jgi:hypothetical protein
MSTPHVPGIARNTSTAICANVLRTYLLNLPGPYMDKPAVLAKKLGLAHGLNPDAWLVCGALALLASPANRFLVMRHGTRSQHRGHYAIRIVSTGKVLKTIGCPFEPPE